MAPGAQAARFARIVEVGGGFAVFYWLVTLLIGLLVAGYGVGFALGCRMPPAGEADADR